MKGDKMEYYKKILGLFFISTLTLTTIAQQSPGKSSEEPVYGSDLSVGRTHYEDDLVFDNFGGNPEPELTARTTSSINTGSTGALPKGYKLFDNYPNPFNPSTTIKFTIPEKGLVRLSVHDILGKEISTLVYSEKNAGTYEVNFNATELPSGLYFYKLTVNNFSSVKKMILIK